MKKNVQNLDNTVKGILLFCDKMPDKKIDYPTDILARKVSLPLMANKEIHQMITTSIEKVLINNEKELTMTFEKDVIVEKYVR